MLGCTFLTHKKNLETPQDLPRVIGVVGRVSDNKSGPCSFSGQYYLYYDPLVPLIMAPPNHYVYVGIWATGIV